MGMAGYEEGEGAMEMGCCVDVGGMMRAEDGGYKNAQERINCAHPVRHIGEMRSE